MPISKSNVFWGKYLFLFALLLMYYLVFVVLSWGVGTFLGIYHKELKFAVATPDWESVLAFLTKFFIGTLAIVAIHFWTSFRIRNLVANLGIGLLGIAFAILFSGKSGYVFLFPYSFPILMLNYEVSHATFLEDYHKISLVYFVVACALAHWDFCKRFRG